MQSVFTRPKLECWSVFRERAAFSEHRSPGACCGFVKENPKTNRELAVCKTIEVDLDVVAAVEPS